MPFSAFDLSGKVALITGGNSGIGLGMAQALAQAGPGVCIWGTNAAKNAAAADTLRAHGGKVLALECDVGDEQAVERTFCDTLPHLGHVDACLANAGVIGDAKVKSFAEMSTAAWHRVTRVNFDVPFCTLRAASRHMMQAGNGGSLVVTSSLAAISGAPRTQHYAATKGAVISPMYGSAVKLARYKIRANAIQPGWIDTAMTDALLHNDKFAQAALPRVPLRRWGSPARFGGLAVYLASDASAYHTGDTFLIDGGYARF